MKSQEEINEGLRQVVKIFEDAIGTLKNLITEPKAEIKKDNFINVEGSGNYYHLDAEKASRFIDLMQSVRAGGIKRESNGNVLNLEIYIDKQTGEISVTAELRESFLQVTNAYFTIFGIILKQVQK
tara:strand:- start:1834 stop:2211 length:378 start_codon:yes stop_codon:yes gene_type:complete